ncbi:MAG: hypothetical protein ABFD69_13645 [Candidatus Sumerlaeia bacterium]
MTSSVRTTSGWLFLAGFLLAAWVAFSFSFTPLRASTDEFWHLKTGRYIARNGLPQNDVFTYTAKDDYRWFNHEWLSQVGFWELFRAGEATGVGGIRALILVKAIFIILAYAGFGLMLARRMREPMWAFLVAAIGLALARRTFYPRPPFETYFLIALVFLMLMEWRTGRMRTRWLWLLAPLFALWANLHGGWAAGIIFIAAFWADAAWEVGVDYALGMDTRPSARRLRTLTGLGFACAAATLANPYGWRLYDMFSNVMGDPFLQRIIFELQPPDWRFVLVLEGVVLLIVAAAIRPRGVRGIGGTLLLLVAIHLAFHFKSYAQWIGISNPAGDAWQPNPWLVTAIALAGWTVLVLRARPAGWVAHLLLGAFFLQQGVHHVRHLPLTALAIMPVMSLGLEAWSRGGADETRPSRSALPLALLLAFAVFETCCWLPNATRPFSFEEPYWGRNLRLARGVEIEPGAYPREAVDFMIQAGLPGPIFNSGNESGYLIWRLAPDLLTESGRPIPGPGYLLFTDNRYDIYGGQFIREEQSVLNGLSPEDARRANERLAWNGRVFASWREVLDRHAVQTLFIATDAPVNRELSRGGWLRVWYGRDVSIWVRDTAANAPAIERARRLSVGE